MQTMLKGSEASHSIILGDVYVQTDAQSSCWNNITSVSRGDLVGRSFV